MNIMEWTFRGFDAMGRKGWVYGDLVHNKKVTDTGLEDRVMVGGYEVVPESVGICTGLKSADDRIIYEGDIVALGGKLAGVVEYSNDLGMFCVCYDKESGNWFSFERFVSHGCTVVGNKFENKNL